MSSILDALKKVEQERSGKMQPPMEGVRYPSDSDELLHDAIPSTRGPRTINITPTTMVAGAAAFGIGMVAISVAVSFLLTSHPANETKSTGSSPSTTVTASATPIPPSNSRVASYTEMMQPTEKRTVPKTTTSTPAVEKPVTAIPTPPIVESTTHPSGAVSPEPAATASVAAIDVAAVAPEQAVDIQPPPQKVAAAPVDSTKPNDEPVTKEKPAQVSVPSSAAPRTTKLAPPEPVVKTAKVEPPIKAPVEQPAANPAPKPIAETASTTDTGDIPVKPSGALNYEALPRFSESERLRLGMQKLKINIVGLASKRQPNPSAYINLNKVYVGETIPGTNARLIGVDLHGVAIQVDGQKYFLENNR